MPGFTPRAFAFPLREPHQLADSHRTPFVRHLARILAAITRTRDRKESPSGLRGKVAFRFPLLIARKITIAPVQGAWLQFVSAVARSSVTQKPTRFVISWRRGNSRQIFLSRISAVIHFRSLGSIWRPRV
jgi:hypothetical protein